MITRGATTQLSAAPRGSQRLRRIVRYWWWRTRFLIAAILALLAFNAAAAQIKPTVDVAQTAVVATRDLAPGDELAATDLTVVELPSALLGPDVYADPAAAVGRQALVAIPAGLPLYESLFVGDKLLSAAPEGTVVVPIRLDEVAAGLLRPGDRIDLVLTSTGSLRSWSDDEASAEPSYLARRALVLPDGGRLAGQSGAGPIPTPGILSSGSGGPEITLVAVAADEAARLSTVSLSGSLAAVLVP